MELWKRTSLMLMVLALLAGGAACSTTESNQSGVSQESATDIAAMESGEEGEQSVVNMYSVPYTLDEMMEEADLVVRGTVSGADRLTIAGAEGGEMVATEYEIALSAVLRGSKEPGQTVAVRCLGDASDSSVSYEGIPVLEQEGEYLLFLDDGAGHSGTFNTADAYYYLVGNDQGVYQKEPSAVPASTNSTEGEEYFVRLSTLRETGETIAAYAQAQENGSPDNASSVVTFDQIKNDLEDVNAAVPPDPLQDREEAEATLQTNLDNGIISQEQYDQYMAELENPTYGEVVSRETLW